MLIFGCSPYGWAKLVDCGVHGNLFKISEPSLLEEIKAKLVKAQQDGSMAALNKQFAERVKKKISRPVAVRGIKKATKDRSWNYDPSIVQKEDITDIRGQVIVKAGTVVNPLKALSWGQKLCFIDGDDKEQLEWAKKQTARLVLVSGSPLELGKKLGKPVFFDQGGILCRKFRIEAVPAVVRQEGDLLNISEVKI